MIDERENPYGTHTIARTILETQFYESYAKQLIYDHRSV